MLGISTIIRFLSFDASAIRAVANSRAATWLGLLFVISAGFAREYDGEYLLAEPWHALIPIAASLIGCFFMVVILYSISFQKAQPNFLKTCFAFLNVYWMTAPMAWLYAIPVERFLDPGDATRANLILLAIVAAWRVALMVRCVNVIFKANIFTAIVPVLFFSDVLAMFAIAMVPGPIFMIMGGVRLSESAIVISNVRMLLQVIGYLSMPVWFFAYLNFVFKNPNWEWALSSGEEKDEEKATPTGVAKSAWCLAIVSLLIWIPILPMTQPEQRLRWQAEKLLHAEEFEEFSQLTRDHPESEFPRHWDPPPRTGYRESSPNPYFALGALYKHEAAQWAIDHYERKTEGRNYYFSDRLEGYTDEKLVKLVEAISCLLNSDAASVADQFVYDVQNMLQTDSHAEPGAGKMSQVRRDAIDQLLALMSEDERNEALTFD